MRTIDDTLKILITALTSGGFMSFITYLIQRRDKKKDKEDEKESVQARMLLGMAHDRILHLEEKYIHRGAITSKEKTNLKYLYLPYKELGGNGDCETGYDVCQDLRVVSTEVANTLDYALLKEQLGIPDICKCAEEE